MHENDRGTIVVDSAISVHREWGPGLLEIVYEVALDDELRARGLHKERQVSIGVNYRGIQFDEGFRADIIVERKVIIELKSIEKVSRAHKEQILTYLKLTGMKLGYLLNFNEALLKEGLTRCVNHLEE